MSHDFAPMRLLRAVTLALLASAAALVTLIAAGVFDPKPLGPAIYRAVPGIRAVRDHETALLWEEPPSPLAVLPTRSTIRLTAALLDGETDSGFGLALGDGGDVVVVAVSPVGYVAIWQSEAGGPPDYQLPWQTWPHVRTGARSNEVWVDVEPAGETTRLTVRVNRELLWQGTTTLDARAAGLWLGSFGEPARVEFQELALYTPDS